MSALPHFAENRETIAIVLLGAGVVGGALLRLLSAPVAKNIALVGVANSRRQFVDVAGIGTQTAAFRLANADIGRDDDALLAALATSGATRRVIIDATASDRTASRHAEWLDAGHDVVTANKNAAAASTKNWSALQRACVRGGNYGDAATVGAGLPVLATMRRLRACGDSLIGFDGVLSGSLSWLFNQYDGSRRFSALLREAHAFGYTEPDPRADLCGLDAARKLVIVARAAGRALDVADVSIENLVPSSLRSTDAASFLLGADALDADIEQRRQAAAAKGRVLRHLAALDACGRARVGLVEISPDHPAARLSGTDNLFAVTTQRYRTRPLVIQGPGAGAEITAQALLGDVVSLSPRSRRVA